LRSRARDPRRAQTGSSPASAPRRRSAAWRRPPALRLVVAVVVVVTVTGVAAFSRQGASDGAQLRPLCGRHPATVTAPRELPGSYPLPSHTVLTRVQRARGVVVVQGFQPLSLRDAGRFIITALPHAGYRIGRGDSEVDEAETSFIGHGIVGHVKVHTVPGCARATRLVFGFVRSPAT
jgi:hypothetical protein